MHAHMTIRVVRKLACMQDLMVIEKCVFRIRHHTADGATSQSSADNRVPVLAK